jgi:small multidrug resistance family-3 protein
MNSSVLCILILSAGLEVFGDAIIRSGLRSTNYLIIAAGFILLGCYGIMVNMIRWDFSKLLGVYIAVFALISILTGYFWFRETIPPSTWAGLGLILAGGAVIQFRLAG